MLEPVLPPCGGVCQGRQCGQEDGQNRVQCYDLKRPRTGGTAAMSS